MTDLEATLREHATDWDGRQMPDLEPAKGDPTAGTLRAAADGLHRYRETLERCYWWISNYPPAYVRWE